jgi:hypothetical protein
LSQIFENSNEKNVYIRQKAFTLFQEKKGEEGTFPKVPPLEYAQSTKRWCFEGMFLFSKL